MPRTLTSQGPLLRAQARTLQAVPEPYTLRPIPCTLLLQACASYDRKTWFRVPTSYDADTGVLLIEHTPEKVPLPQSH